MKTLSCVSDLNCCADPCMVDECNLINVQWMPAMNVNPGPTNIVVGYWKKLIQSILAVDSIVS